MADIPQTWSFAFEHGVKTRDECTREELLVVIDTLAAELKSLRDSDERRSRMLFSRLRY